MYMIFRKAIYVSFLLSILSCASGNGSERKGDKTMPVKGVDTPSFDADSAYSYIQRQADFGPRVPNTVAHERCAAYLENELRRFGASVQRQTAELTAYDGTALKASNIIGVFNKEAKNRVLLMAHWDSRPFSDQDEDRANHNKPILGVDDGASGVGVLLEMARHIGENAPSVGVDIVFFDCEDYGNPSGGDSESWCLGSQYWAQHPHQLNYRAKFGVLLDMVGAKGAAFSKEGFSMMYAKGVVEKIWRKASELGYADFFVSRQSGYITDDHLPVNEILGIPSADIINFSESGFPAHWHTQRDDMRNIDKNTLKAVGQTLMAVVYEQ